METMIKETTYLCVKQKEAILDLWNSEYPAQLKYNSLAEFENYLDGLSDKRHLLLITDAGEIAGWALNFLRNSEQWFAIILNRKIQRQGFGARLLDELKKNNTALNGWVVDHNNSPKSDGTVYPSPLAFYLKNGFTMQQDIRIKNEKLSAVKIEWRRQ